MLFKFPHRITATFFRGFCLEEKRNVSIPTLRRDPNRRSTAFAIFSLTMLGWCTYSQVPPPAPARSTIVDVEEPSTTFISLDSLPISSFQYKKANESEEERSTNQTECIICMIAFEEGESVRQLTKCQHIFHAPCIDQWLYSHSGCPLCRSYIDKMASPSGTVPSNENSPMILVIVGT